MPSKGEIQMKKITLLLSLFCMLMPSVVFGQEVVMSCGGSKGHGYYFTGGWFEDSISDGKTILTIEDGEFDVSFSTGVQKMKSYRESGVAVVALSANEELIRIAVLHETFASIYNFLPKQNKVVWSLNVSKEIIADISKVAMYVADCE